MSKELLNKAINIYAKFHGLDFNNIEHKKFARDRIRNVKTKTFSPHVLAKKAVF
jgi:hypothetical protein